MTKKLLSQAVFLFLLTSVPIAWACTCGAVSEFFLEDSTRTPQEQKCWVQIGDCGEGVENHGCWVSAGHYGAPACNCCTPASLFNGTQIPSQQ
jgi:hypothetical protein